MIDVVLYTKAKCHKCEVLKSELARIDVNYTEVFVDKVPEARQLLVDAGFRSVPVMYKNGCAISLKELISMVKTESH